MLIVLFIIFLLVIIGNLIWGVKDLKKDRYADVEVQAGVMIIFGILEIIVIIAIISFSIDVSLIHGIDKKIALYEEENNNIQMSISKIIENYMNYEQNTYTKSLENVDLNNSDVVILAQLYPDLKSNEMVTQQINIYVENNNKIKQLKENKINYQIKKWWLYFGKVD